MDAAAVHAMARNLFADCPWLLRRVQLGRLSICPFEKLTAQVKEGATVLDIGCGRGLFLALLAGAGRRIRGVGVDMSEHAVSTARIMAQLIREKKLGEIQIHCANHESLPEGLFDVVSVIDVLHHVPVSQQRAFLTAAANCVAPGGLLLYKDMVLTPSWRVLANRFHDFLVAREIIHEMPLATVVAWASAQGLECLGTELVNRYWYGHEIAVFRRRV